MTQIRVADYIAQFLEKKAVDKVFLLSGGGMMHLLDAISRTSIGYICHHHEQASAMAAESYARRSGKLGVCYATSGPGATNIITGLVGAWQDSSPVLFITGQAKHTQTIRQSGLDGLRQFGTFEVDIVPIVQSITKYAVFLNDPSLIRYHLEKAYALAMHGRPGPVLIDIPVNLQGALINPNKLMGYTSDLALPVLPNDETIANILKRLTTATRPLILAGHGIRVAHAVQIFDQFIRLLNMPTVTTQLAKDLLPYDHPLFIGHPGMKGDRAGNFALQQADVILSLGCSLHVLTTGYELDQFAPTAYKIQVEIDKHIIQRAEIKVDEKIQCDIPSFIQRALTLAEDLPAFRSASWQKHCQKLKHELAVQNEPHKMPENEINYYEVIDAISHACKGDETIITDAGSAFYVVGQAFRVKQNQRVIVSGALGTMGFAVPAATGASIAAPNHAVISITGDGSLQTNIHELSTIRHNNLNIKLFVLNNGGYVSIQNTQANFFNGHLAGVNQTSGVSFPCLSMLAKAYDLPYSSIKTRDALTAIINKTLASTGPIICEVFTCAQQEIIPTVSSQKLANGQMVSKPLDDMFPFMTADKRKRYMITATE
ncbi:MAG: hypothetical protein A3F43_04950 [Gammaproteobacteria bacterium RIFCSPHIGHO2_12_FULL_42_10]|nr:MAG: hypothetical protein A3F43_04950 [Gammaproteobacteria bacterium RIFCSPHIGHO2_12_FULL_42_10]